MSLNDFEKKPLLEIGRRLKSSTTLHVKPAKESKPVEKAAPKPATKPVSKQVKSEKTTPKPAPKPATKSESKPKSETKPKPKPEPKPIIPDFKKMTDDEMMKAGDDL